MEVFFVVEGVEFGVIDFGRGVVVEFLGYVVDDNIGYEVDVVFFEFGY